jgi:hypothetical protein
MKKTLGNQSMDLYWNFFVSWQGIDLEMKWNDLEGSTETKPVTIIACSTVQRHLPVDMDPFSSLSSFFFHETKDVLDRDNIGANIFFN